MKTLAILLVFMIVFASAQQWHIERLQDENDRLSAAIKTQNDAIEALRLAAAQANSDAAGRVATVLQNSELQKRTLPQGTGPAVMNQWFSEALQ